MSDAFDVSVIIPTYNRLWSLPKAVDSCRGASCRTEIIVVDDGSTDGTGSWLESQPDLVVIRQENLGKTWGVNRAFAQARGEFVRFLDSDDWLLPGTIDRQWKLAVDHGADIVVAGFELYSEDEQPIKQVPWVECDDFIAQQLGECESSHYSAYLFRKRFIADIPHRPDFAWRDDRQLLIEAALADPRVVIDTQLAFGHRHHQQERLQFPRGLNAATRNFQHLMIYKRNLARLDREGRLTPRRKRAAAPWLWWLAEQTAAFDLDEACEIAAWARQLDPQLTPPRGPVFRAMVRCLGFRTTERLRAMRRKFLSLLGGRAAPLHRFPASGESGASPGSPK